MLVDTSAAAVAMTGVLAAFRAASSGGGEVLAGLFVLFIFASGVWHRIDEVDEPTDFAEAVGRVRDDDWLLREAENGRAVAEAIQIGAGGRMAGGALALVGWYAILVI